VVISSPNLRWKLDVWPSRDKIRGWGCPMSGHRHDSKPPAEAIPPCACEWVPGPGAPNRVVAQNCTCRHHVSRECKPPTRHPRIALRPPTDNPHTHPSQVASGPGLAGELHRVFASRPSPGGPQWAVIEPSMSAGIRDWTAVAHMKRHCRRCAWTAHADCQHPVGLDFELSMLPSTNHPRGHDRCVLASADWSSGPQT
jgi:hypothetical protein